MGKWLDRLAADPTPWLLEKACPSIRYRTLTEIHDRPHDAPDVSAIREEVYAYKPPQTIAGAWSDEGTWFNSLDGFEAMNLNRKRGPGTLHQFHALVEYGWGRDHPIIWRTSELLQGLLWEDPTIDLCELKGYCGGDPAVEAYLRSYLSRRALALLLRGGFASDPGVVRKSQELLDRADAFFSGHVHAKIYAGEGKREKEVDGKTVDETYTIVSPDAIVPDHALLRIFAWHPELARSERGAACIDRVLEYCFSQPIPDLEVVEVGGKAFDRIPEFEIRNLDRAGYESRRLLGRLLQDLEILARLDRLETLPKALELLEWVISLQDDEGIVRGDAFVEKVFNRVDYPYFPLEDNWRGKHKKFTDITFRLFLILRILDRNAEVA